MHWRNGKTAMLMLRFSPSLRGIKNGLFVVFIPAQLVDSGMRSGKPIASIFIR